MTAVLESYGCCDAEERVGFELVCSVRRQRTPNSDSCDWTLQNHGASARPVFTTSTAHLLDLNITASILYQSLRSLFLLDIASVVTTAEILSSVPPCSLVVRRSESLFINFEEEPYITREEVVRQTPTTPAQFDHVSQEQVGS